MRRAPLLLASAVLLPGLALGQALVSAARSASAAKTVVNPDKSITFRLTFPGAKNVSVVTDATLQPLTLTQDSEGVWTASTPPLAPEHYGYTFIVDGVHMLDPLNRESHVNYVDLYSDLLVPGDPPAPWELTKILHGSLTHHNFTTHIGLHYPEDQTAYVVYTPPGYDPKRKIGYPVLYLLHGFSDTEEGWTRSGQADLMLDRMLSEGKIVPMIVVMPRGYGDFDAVNRKPGAAPDPTLNDRNIERFDRTLIEEVVPEVEREYNVDKGRQHRAIIGLSMGGQESLAIGLTHPELFAWVGGMSAAVPRNIDADPIFSKAHADSSKLRLLWVACGTDDRLIAANRGFVAWAKQKGYPLTPVETPGAHTFLVWRDNLLHFAPLLFRGEEK
jgi:enterochelin esterase family protein